MLESVMSKSHAKRLIVIGWSYCILLALALALSPIQQNPFDMTCRKHPIPRTVAILSALCLIISLVVIQVKTLFIFKERSQTVSGPGGTSISRGRLRLYKRAIATAGAM